MKIHIEIDDSRLDAEYREHLTKLLDEAIFHSVSLEGVCKNMKVQMVLQAGLPIVEAGKKPLKQKKIQYVIRSVQTERMRDSYDPRYQY